MRWTLRILAVLALAWALFTAAPYVALYRLAQAVQARDVAAITRLVDWRGLRASLTQQIVAEYLARTGRQPMAGDLRAQVAAGAGATIADPVVARYVTPEALAQLFSGDWVPLQAAEAAANGVAAGSPAGLASLRAAWQLFLNARSHGFTQLVVYVADPRRPDERIGLRMRFRSFAWRLSGIELPATLKARLVAEVPRPG